MVRKKNQEGGESFALGINVARASSTNHSPSNLQTPRYQHPPPYLFSEQQPATFDRNSCLVTTSWWLFLLTKRILKIRRSATRYSSSKISNAKMSTFKNFLRRCIIFIPLFVCCVQAWSDYSWFDDVDCEKFPYHPTCRGQMLRKRMNTIGLYKECDESKRDRNCLDGEIKSQETNRHIVSNPRSKFWKSLLESGVSLDTIHNIYGSDYDKQSRRRKYNNLRIPLIDAIFPSDLTNSNDY
ncbi:uncharacterized protein LOC118450572 [Vespa mandarinia]|uniref:uncharacterized protein LOC118450572 n=1 Tax=Vespa mandarinia TaxID=7446 RepID=UPI001613B78A|nr:uncharacterized protein LOC118450572 [Vespa mandarinia]